MLKSLTWIVLVMMMTGCGQFVALNGHPSNASGSSGATTTTTASIPPPFGVPGGGAGIGSSVPGTGATSMPTQAAIVGRIANALPGTSSAANNFAKGVTAYTPNLPTTTNSTVATGADSIGMLAFAACSDYTTVPKGGKTTLMQTNLGINPASSAATNATALAQAGPKIMDNLLGGLATKGPTASAVASQFTTLVNQCTGVTANTATICFIDVCTAAVASVVMLGN